MGSLYQTIELLCAVRNTSIANMCKVSGVSQGAITDLKMERKKTISIETAEKISSALKVSMDFLNGNEFFLATNGWSESANEDFYNEANPEHKLMMFRSWGIPKSLLYIFDELVLRKVKNPSSNELDRQMGDMEFALFGEVKEMTDAEKQDILDYIRFKRAQKEGKGQ